MSWQDQAACASAEDPDAWFTHDPERRAYAAAHCDRCPVAMACLDASLAIIDTEGMWATFTTEDRANS